MLPLMSEDLVHLCHSVLQRDLLEEGGHVFVVELQAFLAAELLAVEGERERSQKPPSARLLRVKLSSSRCSSKSRAQ